MPLMDWTPALDVGVESMNAEHRQILAAMNDIYDADAAGVTGPAMMARVARLGDITVRHFADEERFMESVGFPSLAAHKTIHAKLLSDFAAHVKRAELAGGKVSEPFFQFLTLWLSAHIKHVDRKYGDHAVGSASRAA